MDLVGYARVLRRQWRLLAIGLGLTVLVTLAALLRVSPDGVEWRSKPVYAGNSTLIVTQPGFPYGRSRASNPDDPSRAQYLAGLYSELAKSQAVLSLIRRQGRIAPESYTVSQLSGPGGDTLPLLRVTGIDASRARANTIANRVARGLQQYISVNQVRSQVPEASRVALQIVSRAEKAEVYQGRKLTKPIMLLVLGSVLTLVLVFGRDNVQRYREDVEAQELEILQQTPPASVVDLEVGREQPPAPAEEPPRRLAGPTRESR